MTKTKTKTAYAVFSYTIIGKEYMVQGNFGDNEAAAQEWCSNHVYDRWPGTTVYDLSGPLKYPRGLIVKEVKY